MSACKVPLVERLRGIPQNLRAEWAMQWDEEGRATGHTLSPVGRLSHEAADRIAELEKERNEARAYLSRLLAHHAPGCEPLDDLLGVCTQIDNLLCGMMTVQERDEVRAERDALQKAFDARADEFAEMRRESWLMGVRLREARDEVERLRAVIAEAGHTDDCAYSRAFRQFGLARLRGPQTKHTAPIEAEICDCFVSAIWRSEDVTTTPTPEPPTQSPEPTSSE